MLDFLLLFYLKAEAHLTHNGRQDDEEKQPQDGSSDDDDNAIRRYHQFNPKLSLLAHSLEGIWGVWLFTKHARLIPLFDSVDDVTYLL